MSSSSAEDDASLRQGAVLTRTGVRYRIWSEHREAQLIIYTANGAVARTIRMERDENDFFTAFDPEGQAGDLYKYSVGGPAFPDPATRYQPQGVHGPSMVMRNDFEWNDDGWIAPPLRELVIYELHVGTFTAEGSFAAAAEKLAHLASTGFNAIEIMPVADFPGDRNWGYDGVCIYAPARVYGTPNEFRNLIDAAHANGIAVILDVVYNHFGPDGNYVGAFHSGYFHRTHKTPWGSAFNFERAPVRAFFLQNIEYWMDEFHVDGFRLDATHAIVDSSDTHILSEIAAVAQERGGFVIAEDDRNDPALVTEVENGGVGLDGCWADDFHHVVSVTLTGNTDAYFNNYDGTAAELATTLRQGWLFTGQVQRTSGKHRGGDPSCLPPERLVYCISNHDQVGNRAFGERLSHLLSPAAYRAASALLLLSPYTPLVFMGQEWAASSPFQYFTHHNDDLGQKVVAGRRREFRGFGAFRDANVRESIPSPQAEETFRRSKLKWDESKQPEREGVLNLYRTCLKLRTELRALRDRSRENWRVVQLASDIVAIVYAVAGSSPCILVVDLTGAGIPMMELPKLFGGERSEVIFDSNAAEFSDGADSNSQQPRTLLLQTVR